MNKRERLYKLRQLLGTRRSLATADLLHALGGISRATLPCGPAPALAWKSRQRLTALPSPSGRWVGGEGNGHGADFHEQWTGWAGQAASDMLARSPKMQHPPQADPPPGISQPVSSRPDSKALPARTKRCSGVDALYGDSQNKNFRMPKSISIQRKIARLNSGNPPRLMDLFAGCGGISLGFATAGFELVASVEFDARAAESHGANFAGINYQESL